MKNGPQAKTKTAGMRTWVEVDTKALKHNVSVFEHLIGEEVSLMAVVKSNAYGHGLVGYSQVLAKAGVKAFAVDSFDEAAALRLAGIKGMILVLGYTPAMLYKEAVKHDVSLTVSHREHVSSVRGIPLSFHLKIDTGMNRQGVAPEDLPEILSLLSAKGAKARFEGVYTHFGSAKNPAFVKNTLSQIARFEESLGLIAHAGFSPVRHVGATGGTLVHPEARYDMVRVGIGLTGHFPSYETEIYYKDSINLRSVLSWRSVVGEVKISRGGGVGYDFTEEVLPGTKLAVVPIGYWHGYPRALSSIGGAVIAGKYAKVVGRISMDMTVFNVTDNPSVRIGSPVVLIGSDDPRISLEEVARRADMISYNVLTGIEAGIPRVYR